MSPLNKRLPRELLHNLGKYLGLFLLMTMAIAATSGFLVAASSIQRVQEEAPERYHVEDFHFVTQFEMKKTDISAVEELGGTLYKDFCSDVALSVPGNAEEMTVRLIEERDEVNLGYYFAGQPPAAADEIALDRCFCANNGLQVGDTLTVNGQEVTLTGIMSLSDYECLMEKNTDMIFNALTFTVSQVTPEGFRALAAGKVDYRYDMVLDDRALSSEERLDLEEELVELLGERDVMLTDLVDSDSNMAIFFATDDVKGDQIMWEVLLGILIVIMAFVFVVLTDATIEQESAVIGTLLASGYRKGELIRHYMVLPTLTGLLGCALGNVLGYTLMSEPMRNLYYNSYSLPPYQAFFNVRVLVITTIVPFVLLVSITLLGLVRKLGATPLAFLRHEIGHKSRRTTLVLPERLSFVMRFRLRVFLRNVSHFIVLFFGISFCSLLLLFGLCLMPVIEHYVEALQRDAVAEHLYLLKTPLEIDGDASERAAWAAAEALATTEDPEEVFDLSELLDYYTKAMTIDEDAHPVNSLENSEEAIAQAEKFAATTLTVPRVYSSGSEEVSVYGIQEHSRYWADVDVSGRQVVIGSGLAKKCHLKAGETVTFTSKVGSDTYDLTIAGIWGSSGNMNVYLERGYFNEIFDEDDDYFSGYASDLPLALNQRYVATDITPDSLSSAAEQMQTSMGSLTSMMLGVSIPIYLILIYLLTKTVIDRSARYISYMKVFGYRNREVIRLYVRSITTTVLVSLVASLPFVIWLVSMLVVLAMDSYSGNIEIYIEPQLLVQIVAIGAATYLVVAAIHVFNIRRVGLALAMKVQE